MKSIGIIVNPFSSKDLRRITSHSSIITNKKIVIKVIKLLSVIQHFGIDCVYLMPDQFGVNYSIMEKTFVDGININVQMLNFVPTSDYRDDL